MNQTQTAKSTKKSMAAKIDIQEMLHKFKRHDADVGSSEIQIILLTERISHSTRHLMNAKKDFSAKRAVPKMVAKRKRLLAYLKKENNDIYIRLAQDLRLK